MTDKKISTEQVGGLWYGTINGARVAGPYLNKGMATRQARKIAEKSI